MKRIHSTPDRLLYCDVCHESEVEEIRSASDELTRMYDPEDESGCIVCEYCVPSWIEPNQIENE